MCFLRVGVNKLEAENRQLAIEGLRSSHNRCHVVLAIEARSEGLDKGQ